MNTCACGAKLRMAQKFCDRCGAGTDVDVPQAAAVRKCASCGITQENYRLKHRWADPERGPKPDEKPYPYRTELTALNGKFYCDEHNPQFQHSLIEMRKFVREASERTASRSAAPGAVKNPVLDAVMDKLNWQTSREANK